MALSQTSVLKLYKTVIEDVISGMKDSFLDEGVDEQVLLELKQIWESKLMGSKAVEVNPEPPEPQPPQLTSHKNPAASKAANHFAQHQISIAATIGQLQTQSQPPPQVSAPQSQTQSQAQLQQSSQQQHQQQQQLQQQPPPPPPLQQQQPQPQPQPIRTAPQQTTSVPIQQHTTIPVQQVITAPAALFERQVPIQITLPGNASTGDGKPKVLSIQVPASAIQSNQLHTILTGNIITAAMGFPENVASRLLQQHVDKTLQGQAALASIEINQSSQVNPQPLNMFRQDFSNSTVVDSKPPGNIAQLDGQYGDSSDDDDDDDEEENDDDDEDLDDKDEEEHDDTGAREEEPLNSEDDVTDDDPTDLFDTDNVVVCQYDKITRSRNKWKFYLKDGIMNLSGKDYVFQRANGDAEW